LGFSWLHWAQPHGPQFKGVNAFSPEKEAALETQMAVEVRSHTMPANSDHLDHCRVNRAVRQSPHEQSVPVDIRCCFSDGPTHELVPIPGGCILIPASLILNANSEDEFEVMRPLKRPSKGTPMLWQFAFWTTGRRSRSGT
jgi:hypothetical protein